VWEDEVLAGIRVAYLAAAVVLLTLLPLANAPVVLVLFVAVDLAAAALLLRQPEPRSRAVVLIGRDDGSLTLLRRTVPALRARRPVAAVEAQVRWREAAEARRRFHVVAGLPARQ
jgi:hypothetical protein